MKPFNLQEALAGKPVVDRTGDGVTDLHYFGSATGQKLYGVTDGGVESWTNNGRYFENSPVDSPFDLFMASEKKEGWVNLYQSNTDYLAAYVQGGKQATHVFRTQEDAGKHREEVLKDRYITTIRIEWEE
jgi:hypothetical protein